MKSTVFRIRSYGWQELALLYNPGVMPLSAVKRLRAWVNMNPQLYAELEAAGYKKKKHYLTPLQVEIIVRYLGEP